LTVLVNAVAAQHRMTVAIVMVAMQLILVVAVMSQLLLDVIMFAVLML